MTTKHSPLSAIKAQADKIAKMLKAFERGEIPAVPNVAKLIKARDNNENFIFGVVMDDKFLKIEMPWTLIRENSEVGLSEWIIRQMREERDAAH
jgi:hypothetical protein